MVKKRWAWINHTYWLASKIVHDRIQRWQVLLYRFQGGRDWWGQGTQRGNNKRRAPELWQLSQGEDFHSGIVKDREGERPSLNKDTVKTMFDEQPEMRKLNSGSGRWQYERKPNLPCPSLPLSLSLLTLWENVYLINLQGPFLLDCRCFSFPIDQKEWRKTILHILRPFCFVLLFFYVPLQIVPKFKSISKRRNARIVLELHSQLLSDKGRRKAHQIFLPQQVASRRS